MRWDLFPQIYIISFGLCVCDFAFCDAPNDDENKNERKMCIEIDLLWVMEHGEWRWDSERWEGENAGEHKRKTSTERVVDGGGAIHKTIYKRNECLFIRIMRNQSKLIACDAV